MTDDEEALKLADSLIRKHSSHFPGHPLRCEEEQLGLHVRRLVEEKRALRTDLLEALDLLDSLLFNAPLMYLYLRHVLTHGV